MAHRPLSVGRLLGGMAIPTVLGGAILLLSMDQITQMATQPSGVPLWAWHLFFAFWLICYPLMGLGACLVNQTAHPLRRHALVVYAVGLTVNCSFVPLLFVLKQAGIALFVLLFLLLLSGIMTARFWHIRPAAGKLQLFYLFSICFGACLNTLVWITGV